MRTRPIGTLAIIVAMTVTYFPTPALTRDPASVEAPLINTPVGAAELPAVRAAAEAGDAIAQYRLGRAYQRDDAGVRRQSDADQKSILWLSKAAVQGLAAAEYQLGVAYYYGRGTEKDISRAVYWWHEAAVQGDESSKAELAIAYLNHQWAPSDDAEARWMAPETERQRKIMDDSFKRGWLSGIAR